MRKYVMALVLASLLLASAAAQVRLDLGFDIPKGIGAKMSGGWLEIPQEAIDFFDRVFLPFPEAAIHYRSRLGAIDVGVGARAFTFIFETAVWPNLFMEVGSGPFVVEAQFGGGLFALLGLYSDIRAGSLFFPDLSAWYLVGKKRSFRLGLGVLGFYLPDATEVLPFVFYVGGKAAFDI